jgi:DNA-binding transcriptional regulator GbsR (MarR family)
MKSQLSAQLQFVEEMGTAVEHVGIPRMAGRILAYLLSSPSLEISSDELVDALRASRGSVSTMTRMLMQMGLLDRISKLRDRKDYFRIRPTAWSTLMRVRLENVIEFHRALDLGLHTVAPHDATVRERLEEVHDLYAFFEREFRDMMTRWDQHRSSQLKKRRHNLKRRS